MGPSGMEWLAGGYNTKHSKKVSRQRSKHTESSTTPRSKPVQTAVEEKPTPPPPPPEPAPLIKIVPVAQTATNANAQEPVIKDQYIRIRVAQKVDPPDPSSTKTSATEKTKDHLSDDSTSEEDAARKKKKKRKESAKQDYMQKLLLAAAKLADHSVDDSSLATKSKHHKHKKTLKVCVESSEEEDSDDDTSWQRKEKKKLLKAKQAEALATEHATDTLRTVLKDILNAQKTESQDSEKKKVQWIDLEKAELHRLLNKYGKKLPDEKKADIPPDGPVKRVPIVQGSKSENNSNNQKRASNENVITLSNPSSQRQQPQSTKQIDHPPTPVPTSIKHQQQHYHDLFRKPTMPRLLRGSESIVVVREDVIENPASDPKPNAFFDAKAGILRVYHGPTWGNTTGHLTPDPVSTFPVGNYIDPYMSGPGNMTMGNMGMGPMGAMNMSNAMGMNGSMGMPAYAAQGAYYPYMNMPMGPQGPGVTCTPPFGLPLPTGYAPPAWPYGGVSNGMGNAQTVNGGSEKGSNDSASPATKNTEFNSHNGWGGNSGSPSPTSNAKGNHASKPSNGGSPAKKSAMKPQSHAKKDNDKVKEVLTNGWETTTREADVVPDGWTNTTEKADENAAAWTNVESTTAPVEASENTTQKEATWVDGSSDQKSAWSTNDTAAEEGAWSVPAAESSDTPAWSVPAENDNAAAWAAADSSSAWPTATVDTKGKSTDSAWETPTQNGWGNPNAASSTSGWTDEDKKSAETTDVPAGGW